MQRLSVRDVRRALAQALPGAAAHARMAPQPRPGWSYVAMPGDCRDSGVLLMLFPHNGQLRFVLTRRTDQVRVHKGQVSLPGGGRHGGEALVETALRETAEELGVVPAFLEVLGELSPLYVPVSNHCIYPFVGYHATVPAMHVEPEEVAEVLEVPLAALLDVQIRRIEYWDEPGFDGKRRIPCFRFSGWLVWGATAMILSEMATLLEIVAGEAS
jgi:8-oxo-dGTP pyrophosphatase MutT (NUDIX family)